MFLLANLFSVLGFIVFILVYLSDISQNIPTTVVVALSLISIYCYIVFFEYQRITLMIGRYIKSTSTRPNSIDISQIQMLLSSSAIGFGIALDSLLTGLITGVIFKTNMLAAGLFIFIKYFLIVLIKLPIPFRFLFNSISRTLKTSSKDFFLIEGGTKLFLDIYTLVTRMPHNGQYEDWIYQKMEENIKPQNNETKYKPILIDPDEFPTLVKYDSQQIENAIKKLMNDHSMTRQQALVNLEQDLSEIDAQTNV